MSLLANSNAIESGGYNIDRSLRFRSSASAYLSRTQSAGANTTTYTWSAWIKRGAIPASDQYLFGFTTSGTVDGFYFNSAGGLTRWTVDTSGTVTRVSLITTQVFRDPSAWYHVVFVWDTTQATASNRCKMYVNGVQITSFSTATYPAQNWGSYSFNPSYSMTQFTGYGGPFDGYVAELNFIDGQALTPSSFGEFSTETGVWVPKKYTGTYGTNGFYLDFKDNTSATTLAYDKSGNGNNWTPNNISVTAGVTYDSMLDVPTLYADGGNGRGNYAVASPIDKATNISVSDANLNTTETGGVGYGLSRSTIGISAGKWYFEGTVKGVTNSTGALGRANIGVQTALGGLTNYVGADANGWGYNFDGLKLNNGSTVAYGAGYITGDVIGVALDMDAGTLTFYKNGATQGQAFSGITGVVFPAFCSQSVSNTSGWYANFGQRPFTYTPPTGFKALNTQNLPDPVIKKPNQYMDATTYSGNGTSQTITNAAGFAPDLVWIKGRNYADNHTLWNTVVGAQKSLSSDTTTAETTRSTALTAFTSTGFTLGSDTITNYSAGTYVGWQWKESATAGFDIVTYTGTGVAGRTVSHSLGVAPKMIIIKSRNNVSGWNSYHASLGNTQQINLQSTAAASSSVDWWNNTSPTSSQFTIGANLNISGWTFVAYLFAEIAGFSKFGSYTGNGSADGPFVYCGFRPMYVLMKGSSVASHWIVYDTARNTYNVVNNELSPNNASAENGVISSGDNFDILSNGFKLRSVVVNDMNVSGQTYIFCAFAENPFKYSNAR